MGQRHQIYILITVNGELICIGLHNQWLFGCSALEKLIGFLSVISRSISKSNPEMCDENAEEAIREYARNNHCYGDVGWHPLQEDNNNGITIIDARNASKPKYCFMAINSYTECLDARLEDTSRILARRYCEDEERADSSDATYQPCRGYPLSASDYIDLHYHPEVGNAQYVKIAGLKETLKNFVLLSPAECFDIFPELYKGVNLENYTTFWKVCENYSYLTHNINTFINHNMLSEQLHNDPRELAWMRRKNFIMFLFTIGYRVTASTAAKGRTPPQIVGKEGVSLKAQNRVFFDESGLMKYILKFL